MAQSNPQGIRDAKLSELLEELPTASRDRISDIFGEIARRFAPLIQRAWRRSGYGMALDDFSQEVLLRALETLQRLRDPRAFPSYLRRIAINRALDEFRRQRAAPPQVSLGEQEVASQIDRHLLEDLYMRSFLEHLPPQERKVLELMLMEELTPSEIAQRLNLASGTVRSTKTRAIRRLQEIMRSEASRFERGETK